jgi:hypothetical protein
MRSRLRSNRIIVDITALAVLVVPIRAFAQSTCGPGQIAVDEAGHCCSPGQSWSAVAGQCANDAPAAPPIPRPPPVTCGPGQMAVDDVGHCCSPGQSWNAVTGQCAGAAPPPTTVPSTIPGMPQTTNLIVQHAPLGDPTAPVPVTFAPQQVNDVETVQIQAVGGAPVTCNLPCVVNLAPGHVTITGTGQSTFQVNLEVPPLAPLTVQVNHYSSPAPGYLAGGVLTALGLAGVIGGVYLVTSGDSHLAVGLVSINIGALALCIGPLFLAVAGMSPPPITLNPDVISDRPVTRRDPGWHFAGVEPTAIPGGAMIRTGIAF